MAIAAYWWKFSYRMIGFEKDAPGVYELGDQDNQVIYIGSSHEVKQRLLEHFHEAPDSCIKRFATQYRVEYAAKYQQREREVYAGHVSAYGKPPKCNQAAPEP